MVYTGSDGWYYFFGVAPGEYTVHVWPQGADIGEPVSRTVRVPSEGTAEVPPIIIQHY